MTPLLTKQNIVPLYEIKTFGNILNQVPDLMAQYKIVLDFINHHFKMEQGDFCQKRLIY